MGDVAIKCRSYGSVHWTFSPYINGTNDTVFSTQTDTLLLHQVTEQASGYYECIGVSKSSFLYAAKMQLMVVGIGLIILHPDFMLY